MALMMSELNLQDVQSYKVTQHDFVISKGIPVLFPI